MLHPGLGVGGDQVTQTFPKSLLTEISFISQEPSYIHTYDIFLAGKSTLVPTRESKVS